MSEKNESASAGTSREPGPGRGLSKHAVKASVWVIGGFAAGQLLRFLANLVLARLLFPGVFGLAALTFIFIQGLQMFTDVGTGPAIVQSARGDDPVFLDTAWTISCGRGVLIWLVACIIAKPMATFYGQPLITQLLPVAALTAALGGFEATALHTAQRHLRADRITMVDLAGQSVGIVANVVLALVYRSLVAGDDPRAIWAIIAGSLLGSVVRLVLSFTIVPGARNRLRMEPVARRLLFGFGRWVFISTLLTFLSGQADRLIFGKLVPLEVLGVYGIAWNLAQLPTAVTYRLGSLVLFPSYSRVAATGELSNVYGRARLPLLIGAAAVASAFVACGPPMISILYDRRYVEAGWILQLLALSGWFQTLEATNSAALLSNARLSWMASGSAVKLAGMAVLLPLGMYLGGFPGAVVGLVASDLLKYLVSALGVAGMGLRGFGVDLALTGALAAVGGIGLAAGGAAAAVVHGAHLPAFAAAAVATCAIWSGVGIWYLRKLGGGNSLGWITSVFSR